MSANSVFARSAATRQSSHPARYERLDRFNFFANAQIRDDALIEGVDPTIINITAIELELAYKLAGRV